MAADALRVCPMASGFGTADHVLINNYNNNENHNYNMVQHSQQP